MWRQCAPQCVVACGVPPPAHGFVRLRQRRTTMGRPAHGAARQLMDEDVRTSWSAGTVHGKPGRHIHDGPLDEGLCAQTDGAVSRYLVSQEPDEAPQNEGQDSDPDERGATEGGGQDRSTMLTESRRNTVGCSTSWPQPAAYAETGCAEVQYSIFKLELSWCQQAYYAAPSWFIAPHLRETVFQATLLNKIPLVFLLHSFFEGNIFISCRSRQCSCGKTVQGSTAQRIGSMETIYHT